MMWKKPEDEMPRLREWVFVVQKYDETPRAVTELGDAIDPPDHCGLAYWDGEEWRTEYHEDAVPPLVWTPFPQRSARVPCRFEMPNGSITGYWLNVPAGAEATVFPLALTSAQKLGAVAIWCDPDPGHELTPVETTTVVE